MPMCAGASLFCIGCPVLSCPSKFSVPLILFGTSETSCHFRISVDSLESIPDRDTKLPRGDRLSYDLAIMVLNSALTGFRK